MKASEGTLQRILGAQTRFVMPVFQRYYSWSQGEWKELWEDVLALTKETASPGGHFLGSLVFVPEEHVPIQIPAYQVIDGQQRLLTLSLLFAVLRDAARSRSFDRLAAEIEETYLVHPFEKGPQYYRVYPRFRDRDQYMSAITGASRPEGQIGRAVEFFRAHLPDIPAADTEQGLRDFFRMLITRLEFVQITLANENRYRTFRSLNSTGVDLSEADLIRNFMFMHVPTGDQEAFDESFWKPIEQPFETSDGELDTEPLSSFFRDYLMSDGHYVSPYAIFAGFEEEFEGPDLDPETIASDLLKHAELYDMVRGEARHPDNRADSALASLRQLESSTTYPLLLNLLKRVEDGHLCIGEFSRCVLMLQGFILRRFICGESSRTYGRWFVAACEVGDGDVERALSSFLASKGFPSDTRLRREFPVFQLYGSRYARVILEALELRFAHKEPADLSRAQIEHVLPQTLSTRWRRDLGHDADRIHEEWLNTIGNLTLSAYNPELQNKSFRAKAKEYRRSNIVLTRRLSEELQWGEREILARGKELADAAVQIWPGQAPT